MTNTERLKAAIQNALDEDSEVLNRLPLTNANFLVVFDEQRGDVVEVTPRYKRRQKTIAVLTTK